jgi:hypothetical protein
VRLSFEVLILNRVVGKLLFALSFDISFACILSNLHIISNFTKKLIKFA